MPDKERRYPGSEVSEFKSEPNEENKKASGDAEFSKEKHDVRQESDLYKKEEALDSRKSNINNELSVASSKSAELDRGNDVYENAGKDNLSGMPYLIRRFIRGKMRRKLLLAKENRVADRLITAFDKIDRELEAHSADVKRLLAKLRESDPHLKPRQSIPRP